MSSAQQTSPEVLRLEARALARMILRRVVETEFLDRYVQAHEHLFTGPQLPRELAIVRFAVSQPLLLPCLDAAAALVHPASLLHRKALLMAAILEASPRYADEFLPRRCGWAGLMLLGARLGIATAVHLAVGLPALWMLRRRS